MELDSIVAGEGSTLIPELHLKQVSLYLWRQGLEFLPLYDDTFGSRKKAVDRILRESRLSLYYDDIWRKGAISGEVLFYIRSDGERFSIAYYPASQFEAQFDDFGDLVEVVIRAPESTMRLSSALIEVWHCESDCAFAPDEVFSHDFGFVPAVIVQNIPCLGRRGVNEFEYLKSRIELHDWQIDQIHSNVEFFGGPLFFSSRSKAEMLEAGMVEESFSVARESGYRNSFTGTAKVRARRVISGLEPGETIGFQTPSPIDVSVLDFIERYEAQIRAALGGVSERLPPGDALLNELDIRIRLSSVLVTSSRRADSYITHGICEVLRLCLLYLGAQEKVPTTEDDHINWRYLGDLFPDSPSSQLTKSIVSRNLLRLGVNLEKSLQHVFPDKSSQEILSYLEGGFAYELLNGVSMVGSRFDNQLHPDLLNRLKDIIFEEIATARDGELSTIIDDQSLLNGEL